MDAMDGLRIGEGELARIIEALQARGFRIAWTGYELSPEELAWAYFHPAEAQEWADEVHWCTNRGTPPPEFPYVPIGRVA